MVDDTLGIHQEPGDMVALDKYPLRHLVARREQWRVEAVCERERRKAELDALATNVLLGLVRSGFDKRVREFGVRMGSHYNEYTESLESHRAREAYSQARAMIRARHA